MSRDGGRELFGTDGVRGLAGQYPLDTEGAERIGAAVGSLFAQAGETGTVIIGCDTRESSADLVANLTNGLTRAGVNVLVVGVITTPGLAYLTREGEYVAGVMVTASHNPYTYNGVKVFNADGSKLTDATETQLNALIIQDVPSASSAGKVSEDAGLVSAYEDFLVASADGLQLAGTTLALDSANGSASGIAERVFTRLGASVTALFDAPDGKNINASCGATDTVALQAAVLASHLAAGVAFDGDADRLMFVDEQGRQLNGDYLLYLLAVANGYEGVVATVMSNLGFEQALVAKGVSLQRAQVGDRYVLDGLRDTGYELGGEQSGHVIFPQLLMTGDGLLAAVQVLRAVQSSGKTLANWRDEVNILPQALVNISLSSAALLDAPAVRELIEAETASLGTSGRLLIRPSGTEPLARVMVEAPDAESKAQQIAQQLEVLLNHG